MRRFRRPAPPSRVRRQRSAYASGSSPRHQPAPRIRREARSPAGELRAASAGFPSRRQANSRPAGSVENQLRRPPAHGSLRKPGCSPVTRPASAIRTGYRVQPEHGPDLALRLLLTEARSRSAGPPRRPRRLHPLATDRRLNSHAGVATALHGEGQSDRQRRNGTATEPQACRSCLLRACMRVRAERGRRLACRARCITAAGAGPARRWGVEWSFG